MAVIKTKFDDIIVKSEEIRNLGIKVLLSEIAELPEEDIKLLFENGFECGISKFCIRKAIEEFEG